MFTSSSLGDNRLTLKDLPVTKSDWDRVPLYSPRIRQICPSGDFLQILFPLQLSIFPYVRLFLGPRLTTIDLGTVRSAIHLSLLSSLGSKLPSLQKFSISAEKSTNDADRSYDLDALRVISTFVCALGKVRTLSVPDLLPSAYQHLATLPTLERLSIASLDGLAFSGDGSDSHCSFPALNRLAIRSAHAGRGTNFLRRLSNTPLGNLHFFAKVVAPATNWLEFFNDQFIQAVSMAWPRLEHLELGNEDTEGSGTTMPTVTLGALSCLAQHCRRLRFLVLPIDAMSVPPTLSLTEAARVSQPILHYLEVIYSSIDSPFHVATFLSSIFPSLHTLVTSRYEYSNDEAEAELYPTPIAMHNKWKEVERLIPMIATLRLDWTAQVGTATDAGAGGT
ncbi:hypothetical protein B0H17DRAFT_1147293 [Mycena rosella]|uniref:Uncharacterized protein n=1 Tax=Mycena rosella TaxID=1033263 RepID=A0AAD7CM44_MYCRO|nr:hypothetical protein B0H17DRAFT_1147293 [Mycena rosella]